MSSSSEVHGGMPAEHTQQKEREYSEDRLLDWLMRGFVYGTSIAVFLATFRVLPMTTEALIVLLGMTSALSLAEFLEPPLRGALAERRVRRLLRRHGISAVHDIFLSAPDGRRAQLDHVAWLGRAIAVIETKSVTGLVERRGSRWTRRFHGRERAFGERTPQQQALDARDVLAVAYPALGARPLAFTVMTHAVLGETFADDLWVITAADLPAVLGRFRQVPDEASRRRWTDLARFLSANRRTRRDRVRFVRSHILNPRHFQRSQILGFGMLLAAGVPLLMILALLMIPVIARCIGLPALAAMWESPLPTYDLLRLVCRC